MLQNAFDASLCVLKLPVFNFHRFTRHDDAIHQSHAVGETAIVLAQKKLTPTCSIDHGHRACINLEYILFVYVFKPRFSPLPSFFSAYTGTHRPRVNASVLDSARACFLLSVIHVPCQSRALHFGQCINRWAPGRIWILRNSSTSHDRRRLIRRRLFCDPFEGREKVEQPWETTKFLLDRRSDSRTCSRHPFVGWE